MIRRKIKIKNTKGIHAIYASQISRFVADSSCEVFIKKGSEVANCKSPVSILMLFIKYDEEVEILVDGIDEKNYIDKVVKYILEFEE